MAEVYNMHMKTLGSGDLLDKRSLIRRNMIEGDYQLSDYVRTEKNHLATKFKRLPNPTLYMFVNAHLSTSAQVPIPAYLTEFQMWDRDHYALPGEIASMEGHYEGKR